MNVTSRAARFARLVTVAAILALVASPVLRPLLDSPVVRGLGPLPACRYDDIQTAPDGYADWSITLVDTILRVPSSYVPPDLVPVSNAGIRGSGDVRTFVIKDLHAMAHAAAAAGAAIGVDSAYRSYADQQQLFDRRVKQLGYARALQVAARPGHSEHQLGTAIDFRSDPAVSVSAFTWGTTRAGRWMAAHAWQYGFLMSYPKGDSALTCYSYEPWHFRYVGRELAALIHGAGVVPRQYLWANFTTAEVPSPGATPDASGAPSASPDGSPVATSAAGSSPDATVPVVATPVPAPSTSPNPSPSPGETEPRIDAATALPVLVGVVGLVTAALLVGRWLRGRRLGGGGG